MAQTRFDDSGRAISTTDDGSTTHIRDRPDTRTTTDYAALKEHGFQDTRDDGDFWEAPAPDDCNILAGLLADMDAKPAIYLLDRWLNGTQSMQKWMQTKLDRSADLLRYHLERNDGSEIVTQKIEYHTSQLDQLHRALQQLAEVFTVLRRTHDTARGQRWTPYVPNSTAARSQTAASVEAEAALAKAAEYMTKTKKK